MACQALNSFTEILFSEDNRQEDDADIENLRRQMDMYDVDDDIDDDIDDDDIDDDDIDDDDIDEDNNDASPAVTNTINNKNTDIPTELTIEVPLQENQNHSHSHSQAAEEAILACRSADAVDDIVEDANGNGNKANKAAEEKKIASVTGTDADGADTGTVETSPLDVTQDNSDSSLFGTSDNSSSSSGSDDNASKSKSKSKSNKNKNTTTTVGRSRSHLSSLHHLKANLYSKANQLRELDTLVSWQSRRTCKLSDPTVSANYDESVEVTAVNVTMTANRRGEDPPEQLEEVDNKEGMNEDELAVSDLEPSPEQQAWSANYAKLADQYRQHGGSIAHITHSRTAKPNVEYYKLRMFIDQQRNAARRGMLSKEQIVQLVAVGMDFGDIEEANIGDDNKGGNTGDTSKPAAFDDDNDMTKRQQQEDEEETDGTMKEISQCASF